MLSSYIPQKYMRLRMYCRVSSSVSPITSLPLLSLDEQSRDRRFTLSTEGFMLKMVSMTWRLIS